MKPILTALFCAFMFTGFCQVKLGVEAGYNRTTLAGNDIFPVADYYYYASPQPAFRMGIISSVTLSKRLWLQPSLLLSEKGAEEKSGGGFSGGGYITHLRLYYAHLPVQVMYTFINGRQIKVSAGAGLFISKGIWGTSNGVFVSYNERTIKSTETKVKYTSDAYSDQFNTRNIKPWDAGYTVAAAAGWKNWQLKGTYDFGAVNISKQPTDDSYKTGVFSLSAGYYFLSCKKTPARIIHNQMK